MAFDDLIGDLMYLRKGRGVSPAKLQNANVLRMVLSDSDEPFDYYLVRLRAAIDELPDRKGAEALSVAFGLEPGCADIELLSRRREWYSRHIKLKCDAIADRENAAIRELATELIVERYKDSNIIEDIPCRKGTVFQESVLVKVLLRDGRWIRTEEHYCLLMLADGIKQWDFVSTLPAYITAIDQSVKRAVNMKDKLHHRGVRTFSWTP